MKDHNNPARLQGMHVTCLISLAIPVVLSLCWQGSLSDDNDGRDAARLSLHKRR